MDITEIDFREWEIDPVPTNATPREIAQWAIPDMDFEELRNPTTGEDFTWQEFREAGIDQIMSQHMTRLLQLSTRPIKLRKRAHD
jgi:hypothetical protein